MIKNKLSESNFKEVLKENGFKITPTRLAVLETFLKYDKPITAGFICIKLNGKINEATVYRILSSFEEKGILKRIDLRKESIYFELNDDHHHHLVCIDCGVVEDFKENKEIEKILEHVVRKSIHFKKIKEHSLELFGYCKDCK